MKRRFKTRRKIDFKIKPLKIIICLLIIYFSFVITFKILFKINLSDKLSNEAVMKYLLASGTNNNIKSGNSLGSLLGTDLTSPSMLFRFSFNNMFKGISDSSYVSFESDHDNEEPEETTSYIPDPNPVEIKKPIVYLYSTHQTENYSSKELAPYNIKPNVLMASYVLREHLNNLGIPTIVETNDITEILRINSWKYGYSYVASKMLMKDAKENNPTLDWYIDIHRDSSVYEKTTAVVDGVKYAKILLIVGKENPNYEKNLAIANKFKKYMQEENPDFFRSVYIKEGPGVNGVYNQDFSPNAMLIELGGQYNTIEEVNNMIPILAKVLYKIIKEG